MKCCCSLCKAIVEIKVCSKVCCIAQLINLPRLRLNAVLGVRSRVFSCLDASCIDSMSYGYTSYILDCPYTNNVYRVNVYTHAVKARFIPVKHSSHLFKALFTSI